MADYSSQKTTAYNLIKAKGVAVSFLRETESSYNYVTDSATEATASYSGYAVITEFKDKLINGDTIRLGDRLLLIPALNLSITPVEGDQIYIGDVLFNIPSVRTIGPSNAAIIFKVQVRK